MRTETLMKLTIIGMALLILAIPFFAQAQTPARTATITFAAPTKYTDGTDIAAGESISYHVYQGLKGQAKAQVATITATATTINTGLAAGAEYCWDVTPVVNGVEGGHSNEDCKAFAFPTPETVTITVE